MMCAREAISNGLNMQFCEGGAVTLQKLHSSRTGSGPAPDYHVKCERGGYRVYDKQQRFRCEFVFTPEAANAYVASARHRPTIKHCRTLRNR